MSGQGIVTTFAGTDYVFSGDGRPATQAQLGRVSSVAVDAQGNVYTGDVENHLVYLISTDGTLKVVAGNGIPGYTGDGGPATQAAFVAPLYVALGPDGDLYIADPVSAVIRRVDPNGIVSTVAAFSIGIQLQGLTVGPDETVYATNGFRVYQLKNGALQIYAGGGQGTTGTGVATSVAINAQGIAVDGAGNLYIADGPNALIREVTPDGNIATIAGGGTSTQEGAPALQTQFSYPVSVAVDAKGNIFVADQAAVVRRIGLDHTVHTVAGTGTAGFTGDGAIATSASIGSTLALATDTLGTVYIADGDNLRVRHIRPDGTMETIAGVGQTRFSGDGGPAANATFSRIGGLARDSKGNFYVSDTLNHRVRRISNNGTVQTVVGTGVAGDTGDGGPATSATLLSPAGLATTPGGDVFIADRNTGSRRIREFRTDGTIQAAAGKPGAGNPTGFQVPIDARQVQIGNPVSIATDGAGNLFYLDSVYNPSIFEVLPNGTIPFIIKCSASGQCPPVNTVGEIVTDSYSLNIVTQVAVAPNGIIYFAIPGAGVYRFETSGALTLLAGSGQPNPPYDSADGLTFDSEGWVVFSSAFNLSRIDSDGIIRLAGSDSFDAPQGDGGSALAAGMFPTSPVFDPQGNLYFADQVSQRVRVILANPPVVTAAPQFLFFSASSNGPQTLPQSVILESTVLSLGFQANATTAPAALAPTNPAWLNLSVSSGQTPRLIDVTADPSNLPPGIYFALIDIKPTLGTPPDIQIPVILDVGPALPPQPVLDRQSLSFTFPQAGAARSDSIVLSNMGGGSLSFVATAATTTGGSWLSVQPGTGHAGPNSPATITITSDPSKLPPQTYRGSVVLTIAGGSTITVNVNMTISAASTAILLSQTGLSFSAVSGGGVIPSRSFEIANIGLGTVNWTVNTSTLSGGANWLQADTTSGSSTAGSVPPSVQVIVNGAGLNPGAYYGLVRVTAPGAANTPQVLTVFLNVLPPGSNPGATVDPAELVFTAVAGGPVPGSQIFSVYNVAATAKSYRSTASITATGYGAGTVSILPSSATLDPNQPTRVVVQPAANPGAGVYAGSVDLQFDDGTVRSVKIKYIVAPAGSSPSSANGNRRRTTNGSPRQADAAPCTPATLVPSFLSLASSDSVTAGWPVPIVVSVKDNCGDDQVTGSVTISFSTGDPPLPLRSLLDGRWTGTWAVTSAAQNATVQAQANDPVAGVSGQSTVQLGLGQTQVPPVFTASGVSSAAGTPPFTPIAPGSLLTITGSHLAEVAQDGGSPPLPFSLGNAQLLIGDLVAPLVSVTPNQIQAIVPYSVGINTTQQLLITRGTTYSAPVAIDVASAQPAVFPAPDGSGPQIYAIRGGSTQQVTSANPAVPGDTLLINCAGLGAVTPALTDGTLPAGSTATVAPVIVTFGAIQTQADSAGLSSTQAGVYQVQVTIPANAPLGSSVPVTIVTGGQTSPAVAIVIQSPQ